MPCLLIIIAKLLYNYKTIENISKILLDLQNKGDSKNATKSHSVKLLYTLEYLENIHKAQKSTKRLQLKHRHI